MNFQKYSDNLIDKTILPFISKKITPNQVSWLRIISIPFIYYLLKNESYLFGLILFCIAALTDALDGAMARKRDQETELGKVLDAVADRGLIGLVALIFIPKYFGWNLLFVIIILEILNGVMAQISKKRVGINPGANWAGKIKMFIQCVAFIIIFLGIFIKSPLYFTTAKILLYLSLIFTFLQSFLYPKK